MRLLLLLLGCPIQGPAQREGGPSLQPGGESTFIPRPYQETDMI